MAPAATTTSSSAPFVTTDRGGWDQAPSPEDQFEQDTYTRSSAPVTPTGRVAQLTVSSINLWSVLKMSLMLSIAAGVALVIATSVLWMMLKGIGVFDQLNSVLGDAANQANGFNIYDYVGFGRVLSLSLLIAVVNVFLLMSFSIVVALIYNLAAGLVGGIRVTLSDE